MRNSKYHDSMEFIGEKLKGGLKKNLPTDDVGMAIIMAIDTIIRVVMCAFKPYSLFWYPSPKDEDVAAAFALLIAFWEETRKHEHEEKQEYRRT